MKNETNMLPAFLKLAGIGLVIMLAATSAAYSQSIKVNELMYAPRDGAPEWIEFCNTSPNKLNVKGWKIRHHTTKWYTIANADFYVMPDSFFVLTKSDTIFSFHDIHSSKVLICPALPTDFLVNTGDTISIHDSTGALIDSVFYASSWGGSDGKSLERISTELSPFLGANWGTSIDPSGSTPGRRNSIAARDYDLKITSFTALLSLTDSTADFIVTVKNCGVHSTSPFVVSGFLDYDNDSVSQPDELAGEDDNIPGLRSGDSIQVVLKTIPKTLHVKNAMAVVEYLSDQDTTNNSMWTKLEFAYPEKSLVANEIMYSPKSPECKWVELFNASNDSIDLRGFTLSNSSNAKTPITGSDYLLPPKEYVVVAHDTGLYAVHPGLDGSVLIAQIPSLKTTGDIVALHDMCGNLIDSVSYLSSWGGNAGGGSLERILPGGDSNDPENWETSADSSGSTPAKINSVTPRDFDLAVGTITCSSDSVQTAGSVTISASIVNRGLKSSGAAEIIFFADRDGNNIWDAGESMDSTQIPWLSSGDSAMVRFTVHNLLFGTCNFGIFIDYRDDELMANNTKIISVGVGLPRASVVVNEIMYAPKSPGEQEWVELYNTRSSVIDLSNFKIATHGGADRIKTGSVIAPEDFAVICKDSSAAELHYPVKDLVVQSTPSLSNSGDWVALYDNFGNLLDSINYVPSYGGATGKSLERIDYLAGDDSTNWHESVDSTGATPGMINSTAKLSFDVCLRRLSCSNRYDVNEQGSINLVIQNAGRNALDAIETSIQVLRGIDGKLILSAKQSLNVSLIPGDSAIVNFIFTPSQPGAYKIIATVSQQQDQRPWNDTLSAWINVSYQPRSIVVNEIMYSSAQMGEYFEVYNTSQNPIDIANWTFYTSSSQSKPTHLSFAPKVLPSNGYFVVAADSAILNVAPDTSLVQISRSLTLNNNGSCIVLADPSGVISDSVYYLPSWHNSDIANTSGRSLEKINPTLPSNEKASWSTCVSQDGGTPGKRNSLFVDAGTAAGSISVAPNPFSPDADGIDDFTFISYSFPVTSVKARVRIFDSIGRLIATPVDNAILPSSGKVVWDGRDGSGRIVRFGLYILLVEMTGPDGESLSKFKSPLVVAKKMR